MAVDLKPSTAGRPRPWRVGAVLAVVLLVAWAHLGVADWMAERIEAWGDAPPTVQRIEVAYVREMAFTAPAARPAPAPTTAKRRSPGPVDAAASAAQPAPKRAPDPEPPEPPKPPEPPEAARPDTAPELAAAPAASAPVVADAASAPDAAASAPAVFEWPVSTRLRYVLTGNVRGEVHGQAQVEWIRAGPRYQVHLDVQVGPSFAPVASRRMSSEGEITPEGLAPRRYEQETRVAFDSAHRSAMRFEGGRVWLANGTPLVQPPGVQDTASQFVQLAYLFDREPQRLRAGAVVEVVLAMPRNVSTWVYDVVREETLYTPFGELPAFYLKPRREARAGGDLVTELWIAPQLRHLPVRFRIRQDAESHIDLMLDRRPELAASEPAAAPR